MVNIQERNNVITLTAIDYDLKIDNNRTIYIKKKGSPTFKSIGSEIPTGLDVEQKKKYIHNLYTAIEKKRRDIVAEREDSSVQN